MDVKLDKAALKALSNDTRVDILKELRGRRYTQSELAEELGLSVPTVKEHLNALESAGLVEMHDEGRKWKYYSLTKKSKAILQPESVNIFLVLSTLVLSIVGGVYSYVVSLPSRALQFAGEGVLADSAEAVFAAKSVAEEAVLSAPVPAEPVFAEPGFFQLYGVWFFSAAALISIILLVYFISRRARMRRSLGGSLNKK